MPTTDHAQTMASAHGLLSAYTQATQTTHKHQALSIKPKEPAYSPESIHDNATVGQSPKAEDG